LPLYRSNNKAIGTGHDVEASLSKKIRNKRQELGQIRSEIRNKKQEFEHVKNKLEEIKSEIKSRRKDKKKEFARIDNELRVTKDPLKRSELEKRRTSVQQEISRLRSEFRATKGEQRAGKTERKKRKKRAEREIFELERELHAVERRATGEEGATGALPDFLIIGGKKCGTTSLYHLLAQHPLVEPAAAKELHFFDRIFDEGIEWYRRCFPTPRWKDGRKTITGEATPYLIRPFAPERMAEVIPHARLIALLRNPVNRAYSDYQMSVRTGGEHRTFEEAVGADKKARPLGKGDEAPEHERPTGLDDNSEYLSRGVYVDQLLRWSKFFSKEQMLVLKSEDFFERPQETLKAVLDFLELPEWEPQGWEIRKKGEYEEEMNPSTRRLLEEYFEPHNRRLYDYLGTDLGW
jgi:sulfotransferase family protein